MNSKPLISIIMNCYNGDKYLSETLNSILSQDYIYWELLFWDNCSTDDSAKIFKSFNDKRFKYFLSKKHTVLYEARNLVYKYCSGSFISFLDVDDIWHFNKLSEQIKSFSDPNVGLVCNNYILMNQRNINSIKFIEKGPFPSGHIADELLNNYFVHFSSLIVRKKAIDNLDYVFDNRFSMIGDFDFVFRLSKSWKLISIDTPLTYYRWHKKNLGLTSNYIISDELDIWLKENYIKINKMSTFTNFQKNVNWYKIIKLIHDNKKYQALKSMQGLSNIKKIKIILALLLPNKIVKNFLYQN